jgi:integrase
MAHNVLVRAIRHAERDDLVGRNVAALVKPPKGQLGGRPSKSLTLEQAVALMAAARGTRLEAYIVLSSLSGMRTEGARALRWDHVVAWVSGQWVPVAVAGFDHEQVAVFVWRAERAGGDTKTPESRRTLARKCVEALRFGAEDLFGVASGNPDRASCASPHRLPPLWRCVRATLGRPTAPDYPRPQGRRQ